MNIKSQRSLSYQISYLVNTSVDDARSSLRHVTDIKVVQAALKLAVEKHRGITLINLLKAKIKAMKKQSEKDLKQIK
jgi:hypothetical protein